MPFGHGPRSCIGMRFAMLEAKIALANMVKNFELLPSKRTYSGASFIYPKNGHFIKAEKHENIGRYWNSLSFFIGYSKAYHYLDLQDILRFQVDSWHQQPQPKYWWKGLEKQRAKMNLASFIRTKDVDVRIKRQVMLKILILAKFPINCCQ